MSSDSPIQSRTRDSLWWLATLVTLTACLTWMAWPRRQSERIVPSRLPVHQVDINHAEAAELALLPGIGPGLAQTLVTHRQTHGPFRHTDDLLAVTGIGPTRLSDITPWIIFNPGNAAPTPATQPGAIRLSP